MICSKEIFEMSRKEIKKERQPYCGKCRNHGRIELLKGHKKDCQFQKCQCDVCILGVLRREINKEQNEIKKLGKVVKGQITTPLLSYATPRSPASPISTNSMPSSPLDASFKPPPYSERLSELEEYSYSADQLVKILELDIKALPFAYAVLNVVGSFENAILKIREVSNYLAETNASYENDAIITSSNDAYMQHGLGRPYFASRPGFSPIGVIRRSPNNPDDNMETDYVFKNRFNF